VPIEVPALRDRRDDIPALVRHFAEQIAASAGVPGRQFSDEAVTLLKARVWAGNIRELRNAVERALILSTGKLVSVKDVERLLPSVEVHAAAGDSLSLEDFKLEAEKQYLAQQLRMRDWNISETARALRVPRSNLYKKIERFGLTKDAP
jgi:two-component system nitrogen regulation response regulator NtrX